MTEAGIKHFTALADALETLTARREAALAELRDIDRRIEDSCADLAAYVKAEGMPILHAGRVYQVNPQNSHDVFIEHVLTLGDA